jgi:hypothetical protein
MENPSFRGSSVGPVGPIQCSSAQTAIKCFRLHQGAHYRINSLAERGLQSLAVDVERRLTDEFATMRDQLVAFDDDFAERAPKLRCQPDAKGFEATDVSDLLTSTPPPPAIRPQLYQDLWSIAWLDTSGNQIFKEDVHPRVTSRQNLKTRPYFTEPRYRKEDLWSLNPPPKLKVSPPTSGESAAAEEHPFFVQSLRSSITEELTTWRTGGRCKIATFPLN